MHRPQPATEGFTGLEAAIILIAFVVVAAVFGYYLIGTGMLTAQKGGEVVQAGLNEVGSSFVIGGTPVAQADPFGSKISSIELYLENPYSENGINVDDITYQISTSYTLLTFAPGNANVTTTFLGTADSDRLLEKKELAKVSLVVSGLTLTPDTPFWIQIQPGTGSSVSFRRTVPASLTANEHYELVT